MIQLPPGCTVGYGITVDSELYGDSLSEKIAANSYIEVEHSDVAAMVKVLKDLKCDMVYITGIGLANIQKKRLVELLQKESMKWSDINTDTTNHGNAFGMPVLIKLRKQLGYSPERKVSKVIYLVNSLPIEIK